MEKAPFVVALFIAVLALVVFNRGLRNCDPREQCEISSYEYQKLHAAVVKSDEVARAAQRELTQDRVTIAQYNRIMRHAEMVNLNQARRMSAGRNVSY